jgi:predicted nucleic acid-binding protein
VNVAIDTNVLVYAEGLNDASRRDSALALLQDLPPESTFLPVQALAELFHVLVRKARRSHRKATAAVLSWGDAFPLIDSSNDVLLGAADLAGAHCRLLLSEDLQDGFTWSGVTVVNPFKADRHPLLSAALGGRRVPRGTRAARW